MRFSDIAENILKKLVSFGMRRNIGGQQTPRLYSIYSQLRRLKTATISRLPQSRQTTRMGWDSTLSHASPNPVKRPVWDGIPRARETALRMEDDDGGYAPDG